MRARTTQDKIRVQLDFSSEALKRLDEITEKGGSISRAETLRNALRLYEWFVNGVEPEGSVAIHDKQNKVVSQFKAKTLLK